MIIQQQPERSVEPGSLGWKMVLLSGLAWALMLLALWDL
jgi:hypothetical protein